MHTTEAEEHLRVIRSLMERATVYRAISAPAALTGGTLSAIVGAVLLFGPRPITERPETFFGAWIAVLAIASIANVWFLTEAWRRRGGVFFSAGMRMALQGLAPSLLVALVLTVLAGFGALTGSWPDAYLALPGAWCVLYGLGLLAMAHFAPASLIALGWAFVLAGLVAVAAQCLAGWSLGLVGISSANAANAIMTGSFGLFHLVYAVAAWPREPELR